MQTSCLDFELFCKDIRIFQKFDSNLNITVDKGNYSQQECFQNELKNDSILGNEFSK